MNAGALTHALRRRRGDLPALGGLLRTLPGEISTLRTWLPWQAVTRGNGKVGKVPSLPRGGALTPVDWRRVGLSLAEAFELAHRYGADGLGVVLTSEAHLTVLDLDLPLTGVARGVLRNVPGYAERSPGGGVHLWLAGTQPRNRRYQGVELLARGYVTVTGDVLPGRSRGLAMLSQVLARLPARADLSRAQEPVRVEGTHLSDLEVLDRLLSARNGARARQLLVEGNWVDAGYPSASEADFAAARLIRFYTQDAGQIMRILRSSALRRGKWCVPYLERTIERALELGGPRWVPPMGTPRKYLE